MAQTYDISSTCPVCGEAMIVSRLSCPHCASSLEGAFRVTETSSNPSSPPGARAPDARFGRLARLDGAQLEFVETFLRCRGVIKNVEDMLGISYPTVKARLANVLESLGFGADDDALDAERRQARREILADLANGRISTEEAHTLLARNQVAPRDGDNDESER